MHMHSLMASREFGEIEVNSAEGHKTSVGSTGISANKVLSFPAWKMRVALGRRLKQMHKKSQAFAIKATLKRKFRNHNPS